ncbi:MULTISPECIES: RibD family protein [Rhizobium/Agrobacterium group]|uniref:RibD family protein n=2 Tax=Neorhizobium TaxID=1525371 RepID=A0ABV0MCK5_9HYPH|nr:MULTISPECIES: RibD family protein [Rhizobium/Agrobacterium group]KGD95707.1 riboflavin deaminase [Rhizobium sp. YS-1r]MCC2612749.1 RibD family protein [Neorhizobium petrolearium]WGI67868.1 RibD family protein [Neorhizobium petrolearium]
MQSVRMTEELWQHLLSLREDSIDPVALPEDVDVSCLSLYRPLALRERPFALAQVGQSLDGRIATPAGDAQNVSGSDGIAHLHRCRALVDAVIVGVGTVVADNPSLSVRAVRGRSPVRVVVDCNGRMPERAKMLHDGGTPVLVMQADDASRRYDAHEVIRLPRQADGGLLPNDILTALAERDLATVLVEGGARTISRFVDAQLIDHLHVSVSPIIIGSGPAGIRLAPIERLSEARRPEVQIYNIGTDIVFDCNLRAEARQQTALPKREDILMANTA